MSFKNKVVLVTGSSSGIGAEAAVGFSAAGARVVLVGRNDSKLAAVAKRCSDPLVLRADLAKDDDVKRVVDQTIKKFGQLDVLVNNAGFSYSSSILDGDLMKSYDTMMSVNLRAVVLMTKLAAPHLIKTKGNIVNISSVAGRLTPISPEFICYCVSKAGLNHFSACAAAELGAKGVRVNVVSPGPVKTDFLENSNMSYTWDQFTKCNLLERVSEPKEIADLIMYLASDKACGITGSNYVTDNGTCLTTRSKVN